jgi:NAD+ kinase
VRHVGRPPQKVLLIAHTGRPAAVSTARRIADRMLDAGVAMRLLASEADALDLPRADVVPDHSDLADGVDLVLVLGGDGTLLRGAEIARGTDASLLGVNLGHVGFLAEAELDGVDRAVDRLLAGDYAVEERMTLDVSIVRLDGAREVGWALNDVSVEKPNRQKVLDCVVEVDDRPLSRFGCDGVVLSTPTGSTAYAFSCGGPVMWPDVQALLLTPISAHALFARPIVVAPTSQLAVEVSSPAVVWCDGRRTFDLQAGDRIAATGGTTPVQLARLSGLPFTDRLVRKFELPVQGWRGTAPSGH